MEKRYRNKVITIIIIISSSSIVVVVVVMLCLRKRTKWNRQANRQTDRQTNKQANTNFVFITSISTRGQQFLPGKPAHGRGMPDAQQDGRGGCGFSSLGFAVLRCFCVSFVLLL